MVHIAAIRHTIDGLAALNSYCEREAFFFDFEEYSAVPF